MKVVITFFCLVQWFSAMNVDHQILSVTISKKSFGKTKDGNEVSYYKMRNENGMTVGIIDYGGIVTNIYVPDRNGTIGDVVLGHEGIRGYEEENDYFGCIAGRFANRIGNGTFSLDGTAYQLPKNNNGHSLHGGVKGFDQQIWKAEVIPNEGKLELSYVSEDGEEGYPGELSCKITYSINDENELRVDYKATTNKATIINLTNHSYFNLKDGGASSILDHEIQIMSDYYTPVSEGLIPTGEILSVKDTPFDFSEFVKIGKWIDALNEQLELGLGYDHNYVLRKNEDELGLAATVLEYVSGRKMEVYTTEPGIQFYSGNFLKGDITGKEGTVYNHRSGLCLETQHFPDSPNNPHFPSVILRPGETYQSSTIFRFGIIP